MNNALEVVKVDPESMIVECNRIIDIIEEKREDLFLTEMNKVMQMFNMNHYEAEEFTHRMLPNKSMVYKYKKAELDLAIKYLNKCIESLDKPDIKMSILRKDFQMITTFE